MEPQPQLAQWFEQQLISFGILREANPYLVFGLLIGLTLLLALVIDQFASRILIQFIKRLTEKTKTQVDDILFKHRVFRNLAHLLPVYFFEFAIPHVFGELPGWMVLMLKLTNLALILLLVRLLNAVINAIGEILSEVPLFRNKPIDSYTQLTKIIVYLVAGIMLFSVAFNKSPVYLFSALGAMTAVLLLIFKDTILGFVASIQLAGNDMIRVGDWVSMEKYGADGDVIEINLTTIKVRNWDKTISTIPTYYFIADSFKNWRGMSESGGRRIKRAVHIDLQTVQFATPELLKSLESIDLIRDFLTERQQEVNQFNQAAGIDKSEPINGRHLTNLGVFRIYLERYLEQNPRINHEMTCMVRQLSPGPTGVPLEIYAFSAYKEWEIYEEITSDIFDHVLAAAGRFGLAIFQNPSGKDIDDLSAHLGKESA